MAKTSLLVVAFLLCGTPCFGQSLADAARAAQHNKPAKSSAKKVYTNDELGSASASASPFALPTASTAPPAAPAPPTVTPAAANSAAAKKDPWDPGEAKKEASLDEIIAQLDHQLEALDSLDREQTAKSVLEREYDVPFDGRRDWEAKLFDEKKAFVQVEKDTIKELKRARDLRQFDNSAVLKALEAEGQKVDKIVNEGRTLAHDWLLKSQ